MNLRGLGLPEVLILCLATAGALVFMLVAQSWGFNLPSPLFVLPFAATVVVLVLDKIRITQNPWLSTDERLHTTIILGGILLASLVVRLIVAYDAAYFPDEYGTWKILEGAPLKDVLGFLRNYKNLAGAQIAHPPLAFLFLSVGYTVSNSFEGARAVSVAFSLLSIVIVYWFASQFTTHKTALIATAIFAFLPQGVILLSLALTDTYSLFFGLLAETLFVSAIKNDSKFRILGSGVTLGLAFWSKSVIPVFWATVILLSALLCKWMSLRKRLFWASIACILGIGIYGLWWIVSPTAFKSSSSLLTNLLSLRKVNPGPPSISSSTLSYVQTNIGFIDLISQLPAWLTPLVLLFGILGMYLAFRARSKDQILFVVWVLIPILALIPSNRDIRYLLALTVPLTMLSVAAADKFRKRGILLTALLVFSVVGSISMLPIAQQQYAGLAETSDALRGLGLADRTILANAHSLTLDLYLPQAKFKYISSTATSDSVLALLNKENVAAAVILHQARGAWPTLSRPVVELLQTHFNNHIIGGPSNFSWYEIFYNTTSGTLASSAIAVPHSAGHSSSPQSSLEISAASLAVDFGRRSRNSLVPNQIPEFTIFPKEHQCSPTITDVPRSERTRGL